MNAARNKPQGSIYETGLEKGPANFAALSPLDFLARAAGTYPGKTAIIHGEAHTSYAEFYARCRRLASVLSARGIGLGDTVSVMAPNIPPLLEAHYGVPMVGAVLNAINTRLDAPTVAFILEHSEAKLLIANGTVVRGTLPPKTLRQVRKWAEDNHGLLLDIWQELSE